ncbi:hypothetical protein ABH902_002427 [Enterococcus sp. UD-01]
MLELITSVPSMIKLAMITYSESQGNSAIIKAALEELEEGTHEGKTKYWQWNGDFISDQIEKVENEVVYTIEGNAGDKIAKLSDEKIAVILWDMELRKH